MKYASYTRSFNFTESKPFESDGCYSILFKNEGDTTVTVQGNLKLKPNDFLSVSTENPEVGDFSKYDIVFDTPNTNPKLTIITQYVREIRPEELKNKII